MTPELCMNRDETKPRLDSFGMRLSALTALVAGVALAATISAQSSVPAAAHASGEWKQTTVSRHLGVVGATLTYEHLAGAEIGLTVRRIRLVVRRAGVVVLDRPLNPSRFVTGVDLRLVNVWGNSEPEALVSTWECGNRCADQLAVGLVAARRGRLVLHEFGGPFTQNPAWQGQRHAGRFYFISTDPRFFCGFSDCASSAGGPIRVWTLDSGGSRLTDVTRTRPDLVAAHAKRLYRDYAYEIARRQYGTQKRAGYGPLGILAPWCADEYLLGRRSTCKATINRAVANGYLNRWNWGTRENINSLFTALARWRYTR
jgi:hypothetical protein